MSNKVFVYNISTDTVTMETRTTTEEELSALQAEQEAAERTYWLSIDYGDAINAQIRERYSDSQEFAILRQKDEKPEEYAEYYAYCEECKTYVKQMKAKYAEEE